MNKILCFLGLHKITVERVTTKEWYGSYSPKEGTTVIENKYFCLRCDKDLTWENEMRIYYQAQQRDFEYWTRGQSNKGK